MKNNGDVQTFLLCVTNFHLRFFVDLDVPSNNWSNTGIGIGNMWHTK